VINRFSIIALCALLLSGCSGVTKLDFTSPGRGSWQRPKDVVRTLAIEPGSMVADLGAGEGYFIPYLSKSVGAEGLVYAVEVDEEITEALRVQFSQSHLNVEVVLAELDDARLPDESIDLILLVNSYHHIDDRPDYFARLRESLAPEGRVAVIDVNQEVKGFFRLFLKEGHASSAPEVEAEMQAAGYHLVERSDLLPTQIFEVFAAGREPVSLEP